MPTFFFYRTGLSPGAVRDVGGVGFMEYIGTRLKRHHGKVVVRSQPPDNMLGDSDPF